MTDPTRAAAWSLRPIPDEDRKRYLAEGWWTPDETVGKRLAKGLGANPQMPFVIHSATRPWKGTFDDIFELARRVATGLVARGVRPGDVVTFQTPNWLEGAVTFYAAALIGAVVAPIVHIYGTRETSYILEACRPRVHVTATRFGHQDFLGNLEAIPAAAETQLVVIDGPGPPGSIGFEALVDNDPLVAPLQVDPEGPAIVGWTSGTTASPKGVIHSHHTVCAEIAQLGATQPPSAWPALVASPISHAIGMLSALLIPIDRGKAVHLLDQWDPAVVLDLMSSEDSERGEWGPVLSHHFVGPSELRPRAPGAIALPGDGRCSGAPCRDGTRDPARSHDLLDVRLDRAPLHYRLHVRGLARETTRHRRSTPAGLRDRSRRPRRQRGRTR